MSESQSPDMDHYPAFQRKKATFWCVGCDKDFRSSRDYQVHLDRGRACPLRPSPLQRGGGRKNSSGKGGNGNTQPVEKDNDLMGEDIPGVSQRKNGKRKASTADPSAIDEPPAIRFSDEASGGKTESSTLKHGDYVFQANKGTGVASTGALKGATLMHSGRRNNEAALAEGDSSLEALSFGENFSEKAFDTQPSARADARFSEIQRSPTWASNQAPVATDRGLSTRPDSVYGALRGSPRKHTRNEAGFAASAKKINVGGSSSFGEETSSTDTFLSIRPVDASRNVTFEPPRLTLPHNEASNMGDGDSHPTREPDESRQRFGQPLYTTEKDASSPVTNLEGEDLLRYLRFDLGLSRHQLTSLLIPILTEVLKFPRG